MVELIDLFRPAMEAQAYAANLGMAVSTNRKNRVLPAPATTDRGHKRPEGDVRGVRSPHQFRTRNDRNETQQTRSNWSNRQENQRRRSLSGRS
jgi:hypothetical protein